MSIFIFLDMKIDHILNRFVREIYVRSWSIPFPFNSDNFLHPASTVSETVPFLLRNYNYFGVYTSSVRLSILPFSSFDEKYNITCDGVLGAYDIGSDTIQLRDGNLIDVVTTGFHECCERDLLHHPRKELSACYGTVVDESTLLCDPSLLDAVHNAACFGQILLVERNEQMGQFNGQLRERTVALMRSAPDINSSLVLGYLKDPKRLNEIIAKCWS